MKTFADVKRRLVPGLVLEGVNHFRPEASGQRTVVKVQGNGYWYNIAGHVDNGLTNNGNAGKPKRYWYEWRGGAKVVRIDGPDVVTFLVESGGMPLVTLTFPKERKKFTWSEWAVETSALATLAGIRFGDLYAVGGDFPGDIWVAYFQQGLTPEEAVKQATKP